MVSCDQTQFGIVRGTNDAWALAITKSGEPYVLLDNETLVFGLKKSELDEECVLIKKISRAVNGEYYLELEPSDTANLEPGRYFYDVGLQQGSAVFRNVKKGSYFYIWPNATKLGDGV